MTCRSLFRARSARSSAPRSAPYAPARYAHVHITNVAADATLVAETDRQALANKANQLWHTDSSFKATPALASVLSARTIPEVGGETEFVSTRLAWDRLSEEGPSFCSLSVAQWPALPFVSQCFQLATV